MVKLLLVRHGETNYNVQGLCNSAGPEVCLTVQGIQQAQELGKNLINEVIDEVIVSPTHRTRETLNYLNLGLIAKEDSRIQELKTGYEGRPIKEYMALISDPIYGKLPTGESLEDLHNRVNYFIESVKSKDDKTILVITHSLVIKVAMAIDKNLSLAEVNALSLPKNASVYSMILK